MLELAQKLLLHVNARLYELSLWDYGKLFPTKNNIEARAEKDLSLKAKAKQQPSSHSKANQNGMFHVEMLLQIASKVHVFHFCVSWLWCPTFQKAFTFCIHFRFASHAAHKYSTYKHMLTSWQRKRKHMKIVRCMRQTIAKQNEIRILFRVKINLLKKLRYSKCSLHWSFSMCESKHHGYLTNNFFLSFLARSFNCISSKEILLSQPNEGVNSMT
jgi:hypothetical protein